MTFTLPQLNHILNLASFLADPEGDAPQINIMGAVAGFLVAHPDRVDVMTSEEEESLFEEACAWACIEQDGTPISDEEE